MSAPTLSDLEIREKGFAILRRELSRGEFVRFLQSLYQRPGDYTADRDALVGEVAAESIIAGIHAKRSGH